VELADNTLSLTDFGRDSRSGRLDVSRPNADTLVLSGEIRGEKVDLTLVKRPDPQLLQDGFRWVSD